MTQRLQQLLIAATLAALVLFEAAASPQTRGAGGRPDDPRNPFDFPAIARAEIAEPCLQQAMGSDIAGFDSQTLPLMQWMSAGESAPIPWKIRVMDPVLRIDQRYELLYSVSIDAKDLHWPSASQELVFAGGLAGADGQWIIPPRAGQRVFEEAAERDFNIAFSDCLFARPGEYWLWLIVYDRHSEKHNVAKRRVRISETSDPPLPRLTRNLPTAEFPPPSRIERRPAEIPPGPLYLPVANKQQLEVEFIPIVSPPEQWSRRVDLIQWIRNRMLAATSIFSQMRLSAGTLSVFAVDLINRNIPFEQSRFEELNWPGLEAAFGPLGAASSISVPALESAKERAPFLRQSLQQRLADRGSSPRVLILIAPALSFERGSDLSPLKLAEDCRCRLYHVRLRVNRDDVFDEVEKLLRPLHPRTFDVTSAEDFRKVLAEIVRDLEKT